MTISQIDKIQVIPIDELKDGDMVIISWDPSVGSQPHSDWIKKFFPPRVKVVVVKKGHVDFKIISQEDVGAEKEEKVRFREFL